MSPDEFRPNAPAEPLARQIRLEFERPAGLVTVTLDEPSAEDVAAFLALAREAVLA